MLSILIITCIIFQSAVAVFLLNGVRTGDDFDKHLRAMLIILLVHLSTKFLLLAILKDQFLYAQLPTGFSLAYGPLLLIIARSILGRPIRPRSILLHFMPFLVGTLIYVVLVIAGAVGSIPHSTLKGYGSCYEWMVLTSLYTYPIYVKVLLHGTRTKKTRLTGQIANILLLGVTAGLAVFFFRKRIAAIPELDLRLLPYIFYSAIPVLILRYRLAAATPVAAVAVTVPEPAIAITAAPETLSVTTPALEPIPATEPAIAASTLTPHDRRYEKSGLDAIRMDEYEATLAVYMLKSKIYLDPDLSLEQLASKTKISKHHLTQLLNERMEKNFYSFVNEYRINEAIDQLNNPSSQVNILSLAFDCGFNSRSSFNNYFKKITGHTPSAYRKLKLEQAAARRTNGRPPRIIPGTSPSI